jgi:hypothetical protein
VSFEKGYRQKRNSGRVKDLFRVHANAIHVHSVEFVAGVLMVKNFQRALVKTGLIQRSENPDPEFHFSFYRPDPERKKSYFYGRILIIIPQR